MLSSKTSLKVNKSVCERTRILAEKAEYSSLEEYVELKGLGYLE